MPLEKSKSKKARSRNIHELVSSYKESGKIGTSKPSSLKEAISQASAIAYDIQRKTKKRKV